jgi:hypothetical protein
MNLLIQSWNNRRKERTKINAGRINQGSSKKIHNREKDRENGRKEEIKESELHFCTGF